MATNKLTLEVTKEEAQLIERALVLRGVHLMNEAWEANAPQTFKTIAERYVALSNVIRSQVGE